MIDDLLGRVGEQPALAPLLALVAGALLSLSPLALPSIPATMALLSPGRSGPDGHRPVGVGRAALVVLAFAAGMDGVMALLVFTVAELGEWLTRASVWLHLVAAGALAFFGLRLLLHRSSLCRRAEAVPVDPWEALVFGMGFSISGCPACAPVSIAVGSTSALAGGPALGFATLGGFVVGRAAVLFLAARLGARVLGEGAVWGRLDRLVGALCVVAAAYYLWRVASGSVNTSVPGEGGRLARAGAGFGTGRLTA